MKCSKCGSENMKVWIVVGMYIAPEDYMKLTKKAITKKTTEIWSMDDERTKFICNDCHYTIKEF